MSKISLTPNAAGTGNFTIASPATDTDRTLTLPDEAGTVLTSASAIPAAQITGALNATGSAPIYACRAWGNFDGDAITTRGSGNLSIARTSTGNFTFTMATAMPDVNYSVNVSCNAIVGAAAIAVGIISTTQFFVNVRRSSTEAAGNPTEIFVQVVR